MNHPKSRFAVLAIWLFVYVWALPAAAQDKVLTPELILTIRQATDAQILPDGSRIVVQMPRPRAADEKPGAASFPELWLVPSAGGEPVRFTTNEEGDRAAQWSPDGRTIAFLSRRPGNEFTRSIWCPVDGGEALRLTNAENSVRAFKWSPDGKFIAFTVTDPKTKEEKRGREQGQGLDRRRRQLQACHASTRSRSARKRATWSRRPT